MKLRRTIGFLRWLIHCALICSLAAQLVILFCFLAYGHLPIPHSVANFLLQKASPEPYMLKTDSLQITADGLITTTGLKFYSEDFAEPIVTANAATVNFHLKLRRNKPLTFESIVLAGGTCYLPASVSADGKRSSALKQISFRMIFHERHIMMDCFAAKYGDIKLRGAVAFPKPEGKRIDQPAKDSPEASDFFAAINQVQSQVARFDFLADPTIIFWIKVQEDSSIYFNTKIASPQLEHASFNGTNFLMRTAFTYRDGALISEKPTRFSLETLNIPSLALASNKLSLYIAQENWHDIIQRKWPVFECSAQNIIWDSRTLSSPYLRFTSINFPEVNFIGDATFNQSRATFEGKLNPIKRSGTINLNGTVDFIPELPASIKEKLPNIAYKQAPYADLHLDFGNGFQLNSVQAQIQAEDLSVNQIQFDQINANIDYQDQKFSLHNTLIQRGQQWLNLGFDYNSSNHDYAVSLVGSAVPYEYNSILPRWWEVIFRDFKFTERTESLGDFIIHGKTTNRVADLFFGHVWATNAFYREVPVDEGTLYVRGRERYVEIDRMDVKNAKGRATGKIAFTSLNDEHHQPVSIRFNIDGTIAVEHASSIFGGTIANILSDFKMDQAPDVHLNGVQFGSAYSNFSDKSFFSITASAQAPFTFKGIQLDKLAFDFKRVESRSAIRNLQFQFAEGPGSGAIDILTPPQSEPRIRFSIDLKDARRNLALANIPQKETAQENESESADANFDLQIEAEGPASDPLKYNGYGKLHLDSKELGAIQLFGPLSKILQNTRLGFTSFVLDEMDADFELKNDVLDFDQITINGPQTRIHADGTVKLPEQELDMMVRVNLIANMVDPESSIGKFGNILNPFLKPLPNLLSFKLGGTLEDQSWRSQYDPRNLIPAF